MWVNFSAFLARCIQARIDNSALPICKYPSINIPDGLDYNIPPGIKRDSRVMIAAQYILLAGPFLTKNSSRTQRNIHGAWWSGSRGRKDSSSSSKLSWLRK